MKKILFLLILAPMILSGQSKIWSWEYNFDTHSVSDTVIQMTKIGSGISYTADISGMFWSCSFRAVGVDSSFVIGIGGSNILIDSVNNRYRHNDFNSDVLPYTFYPDSSITLNVTDGDTAYQLDFNGNNETYNFKKLSVRLSTIKADTGRVYCNCLVHP